MIATTKLYILKVNDLDLHSVSQLYEKSFGVHFLRKLAVDVLLRPVGLLKLMLQLVCANSIQWRELS